MTNFTDNKGALALDFGTCNSLFAYKPASGDIIIPEYFNGKKSMPSLFWVSNGTEFIGDEVVARQGLETDLENVCSSIKMKLGEEYICIGGRSYKPSEIAEKIIRHCYDKTKETLAERFINIEEIKTIVSGVPASYTAKEKGELVKIIQRATGKNDVRLLSEPEAAGVAVAKDAKNFIVIDIGGGTLDISVIVATGKLETPFNVVASDGNRTAGDAIDEAFAKFIRSEKIIDKVDTAAYKTFCDPNHFNYRHTLLRVKEAKESLSTFDTTRIVFDPVDCSPFAVAVTREEFEKATYSIFKNAVDLAYDTFVKSGVSHAGTAVILVGGSARSPLLKELVQNKMSLPVMLRSPDTAVAEGLALYSESITGSNTGVTTKAINSTIPFCYCMECTDKNTKEKYLSVIVPANVNLPYSEKNLHYVTVKEGQSGVHCPVYESKSNAKLGDSLGMNFGEFTDYVHRHKFDTPQPEGTDMFLDVTVDESGLLTLSTTDRVSNHRYTTQFSLSGSETKLEEDYRPKTNYHTEEPKNNSSLKGKLKSLFGK